MSVYGIRDAASSFVNPVILAQKMYFAALHYAGPWGALTGDGAFTTPQGKMITPNNGLRAGMVSNSPVVIHRELQNKAGLEVRVPMMRPDDVLPKMGRQALKGTGLAPNLNFASVFVDVMRHAQKVKDGPIGEQILKDFALKQYANGSLRAHYARCMAYLQYSYAMYYGHSYHSLNSDTYDNNSAVAATHHPHVYAVGQGKVSYTSAYPGNSGYTTSVDTAIDNVSASNVLTPDFLRDLNADTYMRKIKPLIAHDGTPYRILLVAPLVMAEFKKQFLASQYKATMDLSYLKSKNPLLGNAQFFLEGFAIMDGGYSVFQASSSSSTPVWGPSTVSTLASFESHSSGVFGNIVLGDNAIFKATASPMKFTTEEDDHEFWEELGYTIVEGCSRGDFWNKDDGTTGQYLTNDGSAIVLSYAA